MQTKYLKSFDFATYLKRHLMVGQLDPWRRDDDGKPFYALLVSMDTALEECKGWSGQDLTRKELMDYLKLNNIWTIKNLEEFQQIKAERKEEKKKSDEKKIKRNFSPEFRKQLSERMKLRNSKSQIENEPSITENPQ